MRYKNYSISNILVLLGILLSPFWFIHPNSINLTLTDFFLLIGAVLYIIESKNWLLFPSKETLLGIFLFLFGIFISLFFTPVFLEGILNFFQYILIFIIIIPITISALKSKNFQWKAIIMLWLSLNFLILFASWKAISINNLRNLVLWYGNQNQLYWLISSGLIINICLILDTKISREFSILNLIFTIFGVYLIFNGLTLSAILIIIGGIWLIILKFVKTRQNKTYLSFFWILSFFITFICFIFIFQNWDFIYREGSLKARSIQYTAGLQKAMLSLPFGTGLESSEEVLTTIPETYSRSIHNFFIAYFLEIGILGVFGFIIILLDWIRKVFIKSLSKKKDFIRFIPVTIFSMYIIVIIFQPVPVRRFWWLIFALSWSICY